MAVGVRGRGLMGEESRGCGVKGVGMDGGSRGVGVEGGG